MPRSDTEVVVRAFLLDHVLTEEELARIGREDHLIKLGVLNSLTLSHLIVHLEDRLGIAVLPAEYNPRNFESIAAICAFVALKTTATAP